VPKAFPCETLTDTEVAEQVGGVLLEQSGAYPLLDVLTAPRFEYHGLDALTLKE
jgi:hypothetical protein